MSTILDVYNLAKGAASKLAAVARTDTLPGYSRLGNPPGPSLPVWDMEKNDKFKAMLSGSLLVLKSGAYAITKRRTVISSTSTDAEVSFKLEVIEGGGPASQKDSAWLVANVVTIYFGVVTWENGAGMHAQLKFNELPALLVPVIETPIKKAKVLVAGGDAEIPLTKQWRRH